VIALAFSESIAPTSHAAKVPGNSATRVWTITSHPVAVIRDNRNAKATSSGANSLHRDGVSELVASR
jgi:hypothetical protein